MGSVSVSSYRRCMFLSCVHPVPVMYVFLGCTRACVCGCDGAVVCVGHDLNRCTGWWYV